MDIFSRKDEEKLFLSEDGIDDAFNFKYISPNRLERISKNVRRERMRKRDEKIRSYRDCHEDSESSASSYEEQGKFEFASCARESISKMDQELRRLNDIEPMERQREGAKINESVSKRATENAKNPSKLESRLGEDPSSSPDVLLTIPEEHNASTNCERSPVSRLRCITRKSRSERMLRSRSETSYSLRRFSNEAEYDRSSGSSERYNSDEDFGRQVRVRAHPATAHKILAMQKRISLLLDEIAFRLGRIPLPDGERDLKRRQQRVTEFAIRFSRNYLYDLGRQIGDIQRHMRAIEPRSRNAPTRRVVALHVEAIEQKLTSAHQLLLNALEAYCKHIPSSVLKEQPGKLREILQVVVDLKDICMEIQLAPDYYGCGDVVSLPLGKNTQKRCSAILARLRINSDNESPPVSHTTQSTPVRGQRSKGRCSRTDNPKELPTRFSMYAVEPRLSRNIGDKKTVSSRTRGHRTFGVARKARPEPHRSTPQQPNSSPVTCKSSTAIAKCDKTRFRLPQKEDEIHTMMSTLPADSDTKRDTVKSTRDGEINLKWNHGLQYNSIAVSPCSQSSALMGNDRSVADSCFVTDTPTKAAHTESNNEELIINARTNRGDRTTDQQLFSLVPVIADLMMLAKSQSNVAIRPVPSDSMDVLMDLVKNDRSSTNQKIFKEKEKTIDNCPVSQEEIKANSRRISKVSDATRSRGQNMQLICLPSEANSQSTHNCHDVEGRPRGTEQTRDLRDKPSVTVTNSGLRVLRLAETSVESLLKYRDDYQRFSRSNPMYTSNSQNRPWDVVSWIADKLVDELVIDVSKEFQMDGVIQKIFELEFKSF